MLSRIAIPKSLSARGHNLASAALIIAGFVLLITSSAALAQTTTDRYIAARDHAIQESKAPYEALAKRYTEIEKTQGMGAADTYWKTHGSGLDELQRKELSSLEGMLRQVIGPFSHEGFESEGKFNLETLSPEGDFGRLDGLEYASKEGQTKILVTTRPLVSDWLRKFYERPTNVVRDLPEVLSAEAQPFMTQAWAIEDQHFNLVIRLPVTAPKGTAIAVAFLGELSADDGNYVPNSILAALVIGDRVYLVSQPLSAELPTLDDCDHQWQKLLDLRKPDAAAASAFNQCYASGVTAKPAYSAAVVQAQQLIISLVR